jgi:hypothetical protein
MRGDARMKSGAKHFCGQAYPAENPRRFCLRDAYLAAISEWLHREAEEVPLAGFGGRA